MPVKVPKNAEQSGKMGVAGSNVQPAKTPPMPSHYGGSKSGKY